MARYDDYYYDRLDDRDDESGPPPPPQDAPPPPPPPPPSAAAHAGTGTPPGDWGPDITDPVSGIIYRQQVPSRPTVTNPDPEEAARRAAAERAAAAGRGGGEEFVWPEFRPPTFRYDAYRQPSMEDARNEPGYEFARSEGQRALEHSAAGRGVTRTGGTLKDLLAWGNRFAEQNYSNVERRAADTYTRNYGVARDTFDRDYRGAYDAFQPQFRSAELTFNDLYSRWRDVLNSNTSIATAGASGL